MNKWKKIISQVYWYIDLVNNNRVCEMGKNFLNPNLTMKR